jgi:hypothetical protein
MASNGALQQPFERQIGGQRAADARDLRQLDLVNRQACAIRILQLIVGGGLIAAVSLLSILLPAIRQMGLERAVAEVA